MKHIISFLFQFPLYYFLYYGVSSQTGFNFWWCIPICTVTGLSYEIGEMVRRGEL
jgi:hypothetical protein